MTYAEMYAKVNEWHTNVAGEPLCVHCRMPRGAKPGSAPHIVQFYCSHGRDHGDQSGRKEPKTPQAARADRSQEKLRTKFSQCCFNCTVRRDVPEDDDDSAEVLEPLPAQAAGDTAVKGLSGHQKHLKNATKFLWYFDSIKRQESRKTRGPKPDNQQWAHSGHLKSYHHVGKVTRVFSNSFVKVIGWNGIRACITKN